MHSKCAQVWPTRRLHAACGAFTTEHISAPIISFAHQRRAARSRDYVAVASTVAAHPTVLSRRADGLSEVPSDDAVVNSGTAGGVRRRRKVVEEPASGRHNRRASLAPGHYDRRKSSSQRQSTDSPDQYGISSVARPARPSPESSASGAEAPSSKAAVPLHCTIRRKRVLDDVATAAMNSREDPQAQSEQAVRKRRERKMVTSVLGQLDESSFVDSQSDVARRTGSGSDVERVQAPAALGVDGRGAMAVEEATGWRKVVRQSSRSETLAVTVPATAIAKASVAAPGAVSPIAEAAGSTAASGTRSQHRSSSQRRTDSTDSSNSSISNTSSASTSDTSSNSSSRSAYSGRECSPTTTPSTAAPESVLVVEAGPACTRPIAAGSKAGSKAGRAQQDHTVAVPERRRRVGPPSFATGSGPRPASSRPATSHRGGQPGGGRSHPSAPSQLSSSSATTSTPPTSSSSSSSGQAAATGRQTQHRNSPATGRSRSGRGLQSHNTGDVNAGGASRGRGGHARGGHARGGASWPSAMQWVDMAATYPDLRSFAAGVEARAAGWHPFVILAAMNRSVQLHEAQRRSVGSDASRALLARVVRQLQVALTPYIPAIDNPRYIVNAMWVCAKLGTWGDERHDFLEALLRRLRHPRDGMPCAVLRGALGQTYGNMWWALSEYNAMRQQAEAEGNGAEGAGAGAVVSSASSMTAPNAVDEGLMEILAASAAFIKEQKVLDPVSYKPQEHANILLAAARLGYSSDPELVDHLMRHFLVHRGPFKPQAISNVMYAFGLLYAVAEDVDGAQVAPSVVSDVDDDGDEGEDVGEGEDDTRGDLAGAGRRVAGRLPSECASHVRGLAALALRSGLHSFNEQELSNMAYACARLGLHMPIDPRVSRIPTNLDGSRPEDSSLHPNLRAMDPPATTVPAMARAASLESSQSRSPLQAGRSRQRGSSGDDAALRPQELAGDPTEAVRMFMAYLAQHVAQRLRVDPWQFASQGINNITWAFSTMQHKNVSFFSAVQEAVLNSGCMEKGEPREWASFLFALNNIKWRPHGDILNVMVSSLRSAPLPLSSRSWSTMLYSMGGLDVYDEAAMSLITSSAFITGCKDMTTQGLANSLWGLALMPPGTMSENPEFVNLLLEEVERRDPASMDDATLMQFWQAHLEVEAAIRQQAEGALGDPQSLGPHGALQAVQATRRHALVRRRGRGLPEHAQQAAAAAVAVQTEDSRCRQLRRLSPRMVALSREGALSVKTTTRYSALQKDVTRTLRLMTVMSRAARAPAQRDAGDEGGSDSGDEAGERPDERLRSRGIISSLRRGSKVSGPTALGASAASLKRRSGAAGAASATDPADGVVTITRLEEEWLVEPLTIRVDVCVWLSDGRQVAIEVDGPAHFYWNDPRTQEARARLRNRQLARVLGEANVKTVPYWAWDRTDDQAVKRAYLAAELHLTGRGSEELADGRGSGQLDRSLGKRANTQKQCDTMRQA